MTDYNKLFSDRTKKLAVEVIQWYSKKQKTEAFRIAGRQLLRSITSVAANYRASIRARSDREKYAKLCIVVEEADESLFWLELITDANMASPEELKDIVKECTEIVKVMSAYRKKYKPGS